MSSKTPPPEFLEQSPPQGGEPSCDADRRAALLRMSGYAAAVAPAMLVLMSGRSQAKPPCDIPAWEVGLKKKGHSGC